MNPELSSVLLGLISAGVWGAGDFVGGVATKTSKVYSVIIPAQAMSIVFLLGLVVVFAEETPPLDHFIWGGLAGLAGGVGLSALYSALASGRMGLAAPLTAVFAAVIPVILGAILEGFPGLLTLAGFGVALVGIWLISQSHTGTARLQLRDLTLPLISGLGFGLFFVFLAQGSSISVFWPLIAARLASVTMLLITARTLRQSPFPHRKYLPMILLSGLLDTGGNAFFALAAQVGRLDIVSVISSLYPASTVFLAYFILKEHINRWQWMGIAAMLVAIVLIAV